MVKGVIAQKDMIIDLNKRKRKKKKQIKCSDGLSEVINDLNRNGDLAQSAKSIESVNAEAIAANQGDVVCALDDVGDNAFFSGGDMVEADDENDDDHTLSSQMKTHFNFKNKNDSVPLLIDFATYARSLPVRFYHCSTASSIQSSTRDNPSSHFIPLYTLKYYVRPDDLTSMALAIINEERLPRSTVKYISAPTTNGKTASILPAFLRSTSMNGGGTHYVYLSFNNNHDRHFILQPSTPSSIDTIATMQGAAFIVECVKTLFEHPDDTKCYTIKLETLPELTVATCTDILENYFAEKLGKDYSIWFHVDEHGKMCSRLEDSPGNGGVCFSRGAMEALASVKGVTVIATYTERPWIPTDQSSGVCRVPIALPTIDINQVMAAVPELSIDSSTFDFDQKRMFATLKFRLGFQMRELGFIPVLHCRGTRAKAEEFLRVFAINKMNTNTDKALKDCISLCTYDPKISTLKKPNTKAVELLCGMIDYYNNHIDRQLADVVTLPEGRITVSVPKLLEMTDLAFDVYDTGRNLFHRQLSSSDLVSGTPLETAYYWTLSCHSAFSHRLTFEPLETYLFECNQLMPGRLFLGTDSSNYNLSFLKPNIMYYADEKDRGKASHPLVDLFFITKDNKLVLIDIYGGNKRLAVRDKKDKLVDWIVSEQPNIPYYKLEGVVLAPHGKVTSYKKNDVLVIANKHAIKLLGGLQPIVQWLE